MISADIYEKVIDYCDFPIDTIEGFHENDEILIGSYTCGNYFLYLLKQLNSLLRKLPEHIKLCMVMPPLSENQLCEVIDILSARKEYTSKIYKLIINDFGGIEIHKNYFSKCSIGLGRILFRQYRDFRYNEYSSSILSVHTSLLETVKQYFISPTSIDIDCIGYNMDLSNVPSDIQVYLHYPAILSTYGHICEFASISKDIKQKFRPDSACNNECFSCALCYKNNNMTYYKIGRGIYYYIPNENEVNITGHNIKLIIKGKGFCYEHFSSAKRI